MTSKPTQEELQAATNATLRAHATSDEAKALVARLAAMVDEYAHAVGLRKHKRNKTALKLEYATGAFLAYLLRAHGPEQSSEWVYRSMHAKSFTGAKVSSRTFTQLIEGLKGLAFIDHVAGHQVSDDPSDTGQYAARFSATPALLKFCSEHGVEPTYALDHFMFEYDLPKKPLELRARKVKSFYTSTDIPGRPMEFERTPKVEAFEHDLRELNAFFAKQILRGGSHHGYVRIFHNGDDPDFDWDMGGRLYSQHFKDSYQVCNANMRRAMTLNGEAVAEIDIRASYLSIFLALNNVQLDPKKDPYLLDGLDASDRGAVKAWMVATFGSNKPVSRWPSDMLKKNPSLRGYKASFIRDRSLANYPALERWGEPRLGRPFSWANLMWIESQIMIKTMLDLMRNYSVPSLSVHDSLIVPASKTDLAANRLSFHFWAPLEAEPLLVVHRPVLFNIEKTEN
jgi:hypothetical protein